LTRSILETNTVSYCLDATNTKNIVWTTIKNKTFDRMIIKSFRCKHSNLMSTLNLLTYSYNINIQK
jgi:hypothetical protein